MLVGRYYSSADVVFSITLSSRNVPITGIEKITRLIITTIPVRIRLELGIEVSELL
jgi:hypothetical protein